MSRRYITRAADLPEELPPVGSFDGGPHADESDYALVYSDELLAAAMAAHRAAEASQEQPDPDAARLHAEYAAQRRTAAANLDEHAPTDKELAADPEISAILDAYRAGDIDWLSAQVEAPEHFAVADARVAA